MPARTSRWRNDPRPDRQGLPRDGHHPGREGRPAAALTWTERGLGIETSYDLRAKHRELLTVLDRHDEAIQNEWSHFTQVPAICSYQTLMELVPETARATWYDRAIEAAVQSGASLSALLPLLVDTEETARLACVTGQCTDDHLSRTGYRTVEAAEALDESYPEQAARLWRALGLGIVNTGKSKQYTAAVEYFGRAKRCFAVAGLLDCRDQLAGQVRANHYRKVGFIREFEKVVTGVTPEPEPSFPGKARAAGLRRNDFPRSRRTRRAGVPVSGIMVECPMTNCWNVSARLLGQPGLVVERAVHWSPGVAGHRARRDRGIWAGHRRRCP